MELHILTGLLGDRRWIDGGRWRSQKNNSGHFMYVHTSIIIIIAVAVEIVH